MKNKIKIAVVDDGINEGYFDIGKVRTSIEISHELDIRKWKSKDNLNSHGTICAAIIKKYYPDAELVSIKILDQYYGNCTAEQLVLAIKWCIKKNIKLINISLGTTDYREFDKIKKIINEAYIKGIIIVAAISNKNIITYPAFMSNVIGVRTSRFSLDKKINIYNNPIDGCDCEAPSQHYLLNCFGVYECSIKSNSFATPYVTAKVASLMQNGILKYEEIKYCLQNKCLYFNDNHEYGEVKRFRRLDGINKTLILCGDEQTKKILGYLKKYDTIFEFNVLCSVDYKSNNEYITALLDELKLKYNYDSIIIIGDVDWDIAYLEVKERIKKLKLRTIYISEKSKKYEYNFEFFDTEIPEYIWKRVRGIDVPVPIVRISESEGRTHNLIAYNLKRKFISEGYFVLVISNSMESILFGSEYIDTISNRLIKLFYEIYCPDVIILHGKNNRDKVTESEFECVNVEIFHEKQEFYINKAGESEIVCNIGNKEITNIRLGKVNEELYKKIYCIIK